MIKVIMEYPEDVRCEHYNSFYHMDYDFKLMDLIDCLMRKGLNKRLPVSKIVIAIFNDKENERNENK